MAVDEAGDHTSTTGVEPVIGLHAGRFDRDDGVAVDDQRDVAADAERPLAHGGVVRDQQPDVIDRVRHPDPTRVRPPRDLGV